MNITVTKRNGLVEPFDADKINRLLSWAAEGYPNCSAIEVAMKAHLNLFDGIQTKDIHQVLVEAGAALISEAQPDYQYVTGKLALAALRKEVWGGTVPPSLASLVEANVQLGFYAPWTQDGYSQEELHELNDCIDHDRDFLFAYAGVSSLRSKYLIQDRTTGQIYETPQFAYMLIAMGMHLHSPASSRVEEVRRLYDHLSCHRINLSTPPMGGMRGVVNSYASCALLQIDDTLESLIHNSAAAARAVSTRYGLGLDFSAIRAIGAPIREGEARHSGVIPMLKWYESVVRGLHQGGIRQGSATCFFPWWHYEIEDIMHLRAEGGAEDNRCRRLDFAISFENDVFMERAAAGDEVTLFSPHEVPALLDSYGTPHFREAYERAESDPTIRMKKKVRADDLLRVHLVQRVSTQRQYTLWVDNVNQHGPWLDTVRTSNLCILGSIKVLVRMGDNKETHLPISEVTKMIGEGKAVEVFTYDAASEDTDWIVPSAAKCTGKAMELRLLEGDGFSLLCTPDHEVYARAGEDEDPSWMEASDVEEGYQMLTPSLDWVEVHTAAPSFDSTNPDVFDLTVPETHCFFAGGVLVHNCMEITQPLKPIRKHQDEEAEAGVCILSGVNLLTTAWDEIPEVCAAIVLMLDNMIDFQDYFDPAAERFAKTRRSLGVGITNLAAWLAKQGLTYSDPQTPNRCAAVMERIQYWLLSASCDLAQKRGPAPLFHRTKYARGILPIDTYTKVIDTFVTQPLMEDWDGLRNRILTHGLRHSTVTALMPAESSSVIQGSTNGIEPPRSLMIGKRSSTGGTVLSLVPGVGQWNYQLAFDVPAQDTIRVVAALQKFVDMAISTNLYYPAGKLDMDNQLVPDWFYAHDCGLNTLYYCFADDDDVQSAAGQVHGEPKLAQPQEEPIFGCAGGACSL